MELSLTDIDINTFIENIKDSQEVKETPTIDYSENLAPTSSYAVMLNPEKNQIRVQCVSCKSKWHPCKNLIEINFLNFTQLCNWLKRQHYNSRGGIKAYPEVINTSCCSHISDRQKEYYGKVFWNKVR